ncbi:MAG: META domain-containing protein [Bacteroidales bacterium]|nr:META domain-containing protein [Bacteroidales bacterium]
MKKAVLGLGAALLLVFVVISCKTTGAKKCSYEDLSGKWTVTTINGDRIEIEENPFIEFDIKENKIHGRTGCNIMNGTFTLSTDNPCAIAFPPAATTMMACPDMDVENSYLQTLLKVAAFQINDSNLQLLDGNNNVVMELKKD